MSRLLRSLKLVHLYKNTTDKPFTRIQPNEIVLLLSEDVICHCLRPVLTSVGSVFIFVNDIMYFEPL